MASSFAKDALKICVAQICQNIGWHAVQASPMDILVDVLQRYIFEIAKSVHQYSTQYNRTEPNLADLALTFKDFGIVLQEIEEYVNNVESVPFACKIAQFPVKHPSNLQHPKSESRELLVRPEHIPEYLPLMRPDLEEDDSLNQQNTVDGVKKINSESNPGGDSPSPFNSPKHGSKRSADWAPDTPNKKPRYYTEEEGRPMREVTSVFMTAAGFISPIHEGKTAEASLPCLVDSPPPTPEYQSPPHSSVSSKKESKSKDVKKDKSSKSKKDKESKKDVKKLKSKKEKENKENSSKHDKAMPSSASSNVKKDHSSHKSSKSDKSSKSEDPRQQKLKSDKAKLKARKEELHKMKENLKIIKMKAKMKHAGSSSPVKSPKLSSKKFKSNKVSKPYKNLSPSKQKNEKVKNPQVSPVKTSAPPVPPPPPPPVPVVPKELPVEIKALVIEPDIKEPVVDDLDDDDREEVLSFREESPESRLVIDDSLETQARQERESRLEVIDECIEAVIRRGEEESEVETEKTHRAVDDVINSVARGPGMKKLEPKDIYDFTDTSDESSLSSCDIPPPQSPVHMHPSKKEKRSSDSKKSESPKKNKNKEKSKKKRDSKVKSPNPYSPPKTQKPQFILKVDDRTPSPPPSLKDDLLSSDGSTPSSSPPHNAFLEHSPTRPGHMHPPSLLSHMSPPMSSSFIPIPGSGYSTNPFTPMRPLPSHIQTHFPTPPLFANPSKTESGGSFTNMQPLNLAKSGPSSLKSSPDKLEVPLKTESSDLIKKAVNIIDKSKAKDHKKEKVKKKGKKEFEKVKEKKEEIKEKVKPKEKPKLKPEKVKVDKRKTKPDKKKKEDKTKEDAVPKITMKLSSGTGSTKIFLKPNTKNSTPLSSSPSTSDEEEMLPTPSPPPRTHSPSPSPSLSPPRESTPPPPTPSPPAPVVKEEKIVTPPVVPPPPVTKPTRGRGRGRKPAAHTPVPPARTVITETVGTIVDESGNKIWICPACSVADDGSPMIGCDECDDWYHWVCVGIVVPPKEEEEWFCVRCIAKRQTPKSKKGRKKIKRDK